MASVTVDKRTGNFAVRAYAGINPATRCPMSVSETLPRTATEGEIEAAKARQDARAAVTKGDPSLMDVGTLLDYHIDCMEADGAAPGTVDAYRSYARRHVSRIARVRVPDAGPAVFTRLYRDLRRPKDEGGAGLSAATVEKIHAMLSGCFATAKADGRIADNPLAEVKVAHVDPDEAEPLSPEDFAALRAYLDRALSEPVDGDEGWWRYMIACLVWTALHGGFRRGELCGFRRRRRETRWRVEDGELVEERGLFVRKVRARKTGEGVIEKDPKSDASIRFVAMDAASEAVLDALEAVQDAVLADHGLRAGPDTHLFSHADGWPLDPREVTDAMAALAEELGLAPWVRVHTLRHTHATYLLLNGWDMVSVQRRLGHASSATTTGRYGHVLPGRGSEVAGGFARISDRMAARGRVSPEFATPTPPAYAPKCPLSGETCARFAGAGEKS